MGRKTGPWSARMASPFRTTKHAQVSSNTRPSLAACHMTLRRLSIKDCLSFEVYLSVMINKFNMILFRMLFAIIYHTMNLNLLNCLFHGSGVGNISGKISNDTNLSLSLSLPRFPLSGVRCCPQLFHRLI